MGLERDLGVLAMGCLRDLTDLAVAKSTDACFERLRDLCDCCCSRDFWVPKICTDGTLWIFVLYAVRKDVVD